MNREQAEHILDAYLSTCYAVDADGMYPETDSKKARDSLREVILDAMTCTRSSTITVPNITYPYSTWNEQTKTYKPIITSEAKAIAGWNSRAVRTCHIEGSYYDELFDETCTNLSCGHAIWQNESPNYCSECGAKVLRNTPKCFETTTKVVGE